MNVGLIIKNKIFISIFKPLLFYVIAFICISLLEKQMPGGACFPGFGAFGFLLLIPISVVLFLVNLYKGAEVDKAYWLSALIHLLVWTVFYIALTRPWTKVGQLIKLLVEIIM